MAALNAGCRLWPGAIAFALASTGMASAAPRTATEPAAIGAGAHAGRSVAASGPQPIDPVARWQPLIDEASARFAIPAAWIKRVIAAESGGRTELDGRPITSSAGAMGLMQLMPATWAMLRGRLRLGEDPHDPRDNILAGTASLRMMYDRFGYPGLFGAYSAGPTRYAAFRDGGRSLPAETIAYLEKVAGRGGDREPAVGQPVPATPVSVARPSLFALVEAPEPQERDRGGAPEQAPGIDPLFAIPPDRGRPR